MIKLLFLLFKKQFLKLAFSNQQKPKGLEKTEFVFIDSNGKRYYKFSDQADIPIERWAKLQEFLAQLSMGMNNSELDLLIEFMDKSFNNPKKPDLASIGYAITEMKLRKKVIVHRELMMEMMGALLIREDQETNIWNAEIEKEKITQFEKDIAVGGLADFFERATLGDYIPYLNGIKGELPQLLEETERLTSLMNEKMKQYISNLESSVSES